MQSVRINNIILVIGRRGCGKTTYTISQIEQVLKSGVHNRIGIFDTFDHEAYAHYPIIEAKYIPALNNGIIRVMVNEFNFENVLLTIKTNVRNAMLVFEDAGKYIIGGVGEQFRNVLLDTKQKNIDVIMQYHGVGDVPPALFRYADFIVLFKINDNLNAYRTKIPSYAVFEANYKEVMSNASDYAYKLFKIN